MFDIKKENGEVIDESIQENTGTPIENVKEPVIKTNPKTDPKINIPDSQFRIMPVAMIDAMMDQIYNSNKSSFDLYFELGKVKAMNKVQITPKKQ